MASPPVIRRPLALASAFALGAGAALSVGAPAHATHPAAAGALTASNGNNSIISAVPPTVLTAPVSVTDANWSADGSRAVFVGHGDFDGDGDVDGHAIATVRFDDGNDIFLITAPGSGMQLADPHWVGDGRHVVWAAKAPGQRWHLVEAVSAIGFDVSQISPADGYHYLKPDTAGGDRIVAQRQADNGNGTPTGPATVGVIEPDGSFRTIAENASNPALSPDGNRVAFIRTSADGVDQVWTSNLSGGELVQVTKDAVDYDNPTWSPDGTEVAFTRQNTNEVHLARADGEDAAARARGMSGVPAYRPEKLDRVVRLHGINRLETAVSVSRSYWASVGAPADPAFRASSAVLSRSDMFADALGGAALAAAKKGPLLMTPPTGLAASTQAELRRVLARGATVYLLGGTGALSAAVESQVRALGFATRRLSGTSRWDTSVAIARAVNPTPDFVLAATGTDFPDALAAGAAAGAYSSDGSGMSAVVVLTNANTLPTATRNYLNEQPLSTVIVGIGGGAAAATEPYGSYPVVGRNRYDTALGTAWTFFGGQHYVGVATGLNWPDALAGGALMGRLGGPLMLTPGTSTALGPQAAELFNESSGSVHTGLIFGGSGVIDPGQQESIGQWIDGWSGHEYVENPSEQGPGARANGLGGKLTPGGSGLHRTPEELKKAAEAAGKRLRS